MLTEQIEKDSNDVQELLSSAKYGEWEKTFDILDKKPNFVNCCPENYAWGVLHQAVYWNKLTAVNKILQLKTCDSLMRTKQCRGNLVPPGSDAVKIAEVMGGRSAILNAIKENRRNERADRFDVHIDYKVSRKNGEKIVKELPLFVQELAMYKDTLLPEDGKPVMEHLNECLKRVFNSEDQHWDKVEVQLCQSLYAFDAAAAKSIKDAKEEEKFKQVIKLYTKKWVYRELNNAFAKEFKKGYKPSAEDLALGLYGMLLDVTLSFWGKLGSTPVVTWRGVRNKMGTYTVGEDIMFTNLISSSEYRSVAESFATNQQDRSKGTLFRIDNSADTKTRPKDISDHSEYGNEKEFVYVIGAEFRVKTVVNCNKDGFREIHLELLESCKL